MARKMPLQQIKNELRTKYLTLVSDYNEYENINSPITVKCVNGHEIRTSLKTIRMKNFACSTCVGTIARSESVSNRVVPPKNGFRIIGFDNATHNMGVAIFDNEKLVYYNLLQFNTGSTMQRLNKIRDLLEKQILPLWEPDLIQIEGVQFQNNYNTYEVLTKLHGVFGMACDRFGIPMESTGSSVWRSHYAINHRNREKDKQAAIDLVEKMYHIKTTDDVAEAILIAQYRRDLHARKGLTKLF